MKKIIALFLSLCLLLSLCACRSGQPTEEVQARTYTDDAGREVQLPEKIQRIVPSAPLAQIILLTLAPEMVVGLADEIEDDARGLLPDSAFSQPFLGSLYAGSELNLEALAATAPDLIIDMGEVKKSTKEDLDTLQTQTAIPAVFISLSLENMGQTYRTLGALLGKEERAELLAQRCESIYARTLSIMDQVGEDKIDCLYILGQEGLNVIASGSYHAELLDLLTNNLAVVDNPLSKGTGNEVTMEQIALWDPEFIIFGPESIYTDVAQRSTWTELQAISKGNYVEVPQIPYNWMSMPPSVQRYLGLLWLPVVLYPEYCNYDVETEIRDLLELFYNCEVSDETYARIMEKAFPTA